MDCASVKADGIAESYLRRELAEADQEAFEEHLVACTACFEELSSLCALQGELERSREQIVAETVGSRRPPHRTWLLAVAAAVLAVAAGVALWMRFAPVPVPEPVLAELGPVVNPEPKRASEFDLSELAVFEPPAYAPVRLRGSEDDAARRFREALERYSQGDWRGALPGLRAAAALDPEAPHIAFYLGACALLAGETGEAITELQRTIDLGDTPFLEESLYYLAKAQLRAGNITAARDALAKVIVLNGDRSAEAHSLVDRLDALGGRSH